MIGALKPGDELLDYPRSLLPVDLTLDTFRDAWSTGNLGRYLLNSSIVSIAITVGQIVTSVLAAYAFAFLRFPLRRLLFCVFLATLLVPAEVTVLANCRRPSSPSAGSTATRRWSCRSWPPPSARSCCARCSSPCPRTCARPPPSTASATGASCAASPSPGPADLGALALFSFLGAWNQYLWPLRVTNDRDYRTVQIGLKRSPRPTSTS